MPCQIACGPRGSAGGHEPQNEARDQERACGDGEDQEVTEHVPNPGGDRTRNYWRGLPARCARSKVREQARPWQRRSNLKGQVPIALTSGPDPFYRAPAGSRARGSRGTIFAFPQHVDIDPGAPP